MREVQVILGIPHLNGLCRPSAVGRLVAILAFVAVPACVIAVGVNAIEAVVCAGRLTHILDEGFYGVAPATADVSPDTTVKAVVVYARVVATGNHLAPAFVGASARKPVDSVGLALAFRVGVSRQVIGSNVTIHPAGYAPAFPVTPARTTHVRGFHVERANYVANLNGGRNEASLGLSHDVTLLDRVGLWLEPAGVCAPVRLASFYGRSSQKCTELS